MTNFPANPMMRALAASIRANVPVLLWGLPGQGKTAVLESHGAAWGFHVETVVGSIREASDFLGLPLDVGGEVHYAPLAWARRLADAERGLLFLDELTTAAPSVQRAMLRILQEREVGELRLPETVSIVAAANPPSVAVDGWDLPAPISNRMIHLDWHLDTDEWLSGVITDFAHSEPVGIDAMLGEASDADIARVRGAVTAFLRTRPDFTDKLPTDPALAGKGWASRRSWTNVMKVLAHLGPHDEDAALLVVKGGVGEGAAIEFLNWLATADLHDPQDVLADPSIVDWANERPDRLFALIQSVTALTLMRGDKDTWRRGMAVMTYCAEGKRPDVAMPGAKALLSCMPKGAVVTDAAQRAFSRMLAKTGRWAA